MKVKVKNPKWFPRCIKKLMGYLSGYQQDMKNSIQKTGGIPLKAPKWRINNYNALQTPLN